MPNAAIHPTSQELTAFALGKLTDAAEAAVARHLEMCPACRQAIEKLPADSFVGKLRAAKPSVSALPARTGDVTNLPANEAAPSPPPKGLPPDLANYRKYRFVRELGKGGMGVVYQAEQTVMGRSVAVKVINPSVLDHPDALPRFQSEVRAAAKLDHPNIVRAYDADQVGNIHLLVMEYVEGTNLAELVAKKGPLPVPYACHFIRQAALGLQHAFEQGMVHRDIKPQNLMVNARGQVRVLDFGLARMQSERKAGRGLTQANAFMGTPEYVAPEQADDARNADTRADIFSLGCTLFFLLAGRPPFQEDSLYKQLVAQVEKEAPALHEMRADVPAELSAVVARMLAKDPARRFQTPVEVAQALAAFVKPGTKRPSGISPPASGVSSPATGTVIGADTSKIKAVLREVPAPKAPDKEAASVFAGLGEEVVSTKKAKPARKEAKPVLTAWWKRPGVLAAAIGFSLALILMAVIIIKVKVPPEDRDTGGTGQTKPPPVEAIVVLEIDQPGAEVLVDGQKKITVKVPGDKEPIEIKVEPGRHKLRISKAGFEAVTQDIELKTGKSEPIKIRLERETTNSGDKGDEKWIQEVSGLPAEEQVKAVADKLKERNPGFDGKVTSKIEDGVVTELQFVTDQVTDISPVRALIGLSVLGCPCSDRGKGQLADLSPLKGMKLRVLNCYNTRVSDLSPLKGMKLTWLNCHYSLVSDLSPLKDMKLTYLECGGWQVSDLSPLKDMKLTHLCFWGTPVSDLSPLKDMPLTSLQCANTRVSDLSPLKGMPLAWLHCDHTRVSDLSPLKGMPLKDVYCDFQPERDAEILRSIKTLEKINDKPAVEFWKDVDGTKTSDGSPTRGKGLVPLFNGKDLKGWKTHPDAPGDWRVENGILIGRGPGVSRLYSQRGDYVDFHLLVEAKINHGGSSGVLFHTAFPPDRQRGCYKALIDSSGLNKFKTGTLWVKSPIRVGIEKVLVPDDTWFTQEVIIQGNHIIIKINGIKTVDFVDVDNTWPGGHIALLVFAEATVVHFRRIEIKELPAKIP